MHSNGGKNQGKNNKKSEQKEQVQQDIAQNLMNDVYDNFLKEQINGRQFEELFQEISELIKIDSKERGFDTFQINNFVDDCQEVLLIGFRQELSNFQDFYFDESSPLCVQTQEFLIDRAKKQSNKKIQMQQDFPTLGGGPSTSKNNNNKNQVNIVDKITQQQKKKKDEAYLFKPSNMPTNMTPFFAQQKMNKDSIFNIDNKFKSQKDLQSLHKQFSDFPIVDLKFVYISFVGDINLCRQFLIKYYGHTRNKTTKPQNNKQNNKNKQNSIYSKRIYNKVKKQQIDEELKHLSYQAIRDELDHLYKLKQALQLMKMKIKNTKQRTQLDRMINQKQPIIAKLSYAARLILAQKMAKTNPLELDLHGYRQEQVENLLQKIEEMIRQQYQHGNQKIKTKKIKNTISTMLKVITGKGLHSKGNRSIMKPTVIQWCNYKNLYYEEDIDHIRVQFILN